MRSMISIDWVSNLFLGISSASGSGTGDLLDDVVKALPEESGQPEEEKDLAKIAIIGRPNVGKSSLVNVLLGNDRAIVNLYPALRAIQSIRTINILTLEFFLIDTAGIRKKSKVSENIEFYSVMRSIRAIESSRCVHPDAGCCAGI